MQQLLLVQWGKKRSIVEIVYSDTLETTYLIMDNDYLMSLDEQQLIL